MKRQIVPFFTLILCLMSGYSWADDQYLIEIKPTKKIIHVSELGFTDNTTVLEILEIMPEVISRGGDNLLEKFSIQIDDQDVGQSRDMILTQTRAVEVDKIEVSTSPTASEQKNGQGGVINIILKKVQPGTAGKVMTDVGTNFTTDVDVAPSVYVNYGKDNFYLRASLTMEYYRPQTTRYSYVNQADTFRSQVYDTALVNYGQETAKLMLGYDDNKDKVEFWLMETYGKRRAKGQVYNVEARLVERYNPAQNLTNNLLYYSLTDEDNESLELTARFKWEHKYDLGGRLSLETGYDYAPDHTDNISTYNVPGIIEVYDGFAHNNGNSNKAHEVGLEIKSKHQLLPLDSEHKLEFEFGAKTSYNARARQNYEEFVIDHLRQDSLSYQINMLSGALYASPFVQLDWTYRGWFIRLGARYQYHDRLLSKNQLDTTRSQQHDVTGNISIGCQVADGHHLRLLAARNINRPTDDQLYPHAVYDRNKRTFIVGNGALYSAEYYNVALNYIFDYQHGDHNVVTGAELEYVRADGIISTEQRYREDGSHLIYYTYKNDGYTNQLNLNASLYYHYHIFTMAFAGNVYGNVKDKGGSKASYGYFNLSLETVFSFQNNWTLRSKLMYNSKVVRDNSYLGDCFYMELGLIKKWGNWDVHMELKDVFHTNTIDRSNGSEGLVETRYNQYKQNFLVGFCYSF